MPCEQSCTKHLPAYHTKSGGLIYLTGIDSMSVFFQKDVCYN